MYGFVGNDSIHSLDIWGLSDGGFFIYGDSYVSDDIGIGYCAATKSILLVPSDATPATDKSFAEHYPMRFPGTYDSAFNEAIKHINRQLTYLCSGKGPPNLEDTRVLSIFGYGTGERRGVISQKTEGDYGDKDQSPYESALSLGNYAFYVKDLKVTKMNSNCCCCYEYSAKLVLQDTLGLHPSNVSPILFPIFAGIFGEERSYDAAIWDISGVHCDPK